MSKITLSKIKLLGLGLIVVGSLSLTVLHFFDNFLPPADKAKAAFAIPILLFTGYISLAGGVFFVILDVIWELIFGRSLSSYKDNEKSEQD